MATPNEKLAASLAKLQMLQTDGRCVFRSSELSKTHRKRLVDQGFLEPVIGGWLISTRPGIEPGDSTPWFAS
ncbi:MAG: cell filamentation protein Fic, partial [Steroidobacteraceae bacterium]